MKYARLTKEQLEELHPEFINFLATQSIDKKEWDKIKTNKPQVAMQEVDVFSDLIWERALSNVNFIDYFSTNYIFLFKCVDSLVYSLVINTNDKKVDFLTKEGIEWLSINMFSDSVEIQKGKKDISHDRNQALFKIIKEGGIISKGELFSKLEHLINT
jgi:hypothetical protein